MLSVLIFFIIEDRFQKYVRTLIISQVLSNILGAYEIILWREIWILFKKEIFFNSLNRILFSFTCNEVF